MEQWDSESSLAHTAPCARAHLPFGVSCYEPQWSAGGQLTDFVIQDLNLAYAQIFFHPPDRLLGHRLSESWPDTQTEFTRILLEIEKQMQASSANVSLKLKIYEQIYQLDLYQTETNCWLVFWDPLNSGPDIASESVNPAADQTSARAVTLKEGSDSDDEDGLALLYQLGGGGCPNRYLPVILNVLDHKSNGTREHGFRMSHYIKQLARHMQLSDRLTRDLILAAMLHDIGKIGVRREILDKPCQLSPLERQEIEHHTVYGYRLLRNIPGLTQVAYYVLSHHERFDGSGYPQGLKGQEIPLPSRIIAVLDAYDVMTNGRPYQAAIPQELAVAELRCCSGGQFDGEIVEAFVALLEQEKRAAGL
ncbi:HD domain-containing protein [Oscillospiraceae bacterium HV4-5-C5C]|nr:HD domain-containing protein [Oscillospiraceae bacterium HV4-5-C5C]